MMNGKIGFSLILFLFSISCHNEETGALPIFFSCSNLLSSCNNVIDAPYCTFGYKLGDSNPYSPSGPGISGPGTKANSISYKFLEAGVMFKSIHQNQGISMSLSESDKSEIRAAVLQWSAVADINFNEKASDETTDITILSAFIPTSGKEGEATCGLGHPSFNNQPCLQLAGLLIINPKCNQIVPISLHEMGHVLGLGHVASENVMNPDRLGFFPSLQSGDIMGIQSIYGKK
jgi:hypothetical protein